MFGRQLTIEIHNVVPDALENVTAAVARHKSAQLLGLVHAENQDADQRDGHDREDDGKAAESPPPADVCVEPLGSLGAGKGGDDVRGRREGVGQSSILELGDVGCEHVHAECHPSEPDAVEDLRGYFVSAPSYALSS